jgi:hypothetical protein
MIYYCTKDQRKYIEPSNIPKGMKLCGFQSSSAMSAPKSKRVDEVSKLEER